MASIENLEIVVDVNISEAVAKLDQLQEELQDIAETIEAVDTRGTEGIDIRTSVDNLDTELAKLKGQIEAFEASESINVGANVAGGHTMPGRLQMMQAGGADNIGELFDLHLDRDRPGRFTQMMETFHDSISEAIEPLQQFDLRMTDIHNALARLVPLIILMIGTIPAVVTAFVGLAAAALSAAAALLAIGGFGALGVGLVGGQFDMQRLTSVWEDIQSSFIEAFAPLAERLEPLFRDAIDGLELFFNAVADQGDALMALTDEARGFGRFMMDFIPVLLRTMASMAEAFGPTFGNIANFLQREFATIMRTLVRLTAEALPAVSQLILRLGRAIPFLVKLSVGITRAANAFLFMTGVLAEALSLFGISPEFIGAFIGAVLVAVTGVLLLNSALLATVTKGLVRFGAFLISTIGKLLGFSSASIMATIASWGLYQALAALIGLTGIGLLLVGLSAGVSALGTRFAGAASDVDSLTNSLREFDRVSGRAGGGQFNPYSGSGGPPSGAGAASGGGAPTPGRGTTINIETSGDEDEDTSRAKYAGWRQGRTSGGNN